MSDNQNQPREYDAVRGGQNSIPVNAAVLGGGGWEGIPDTVRNAADTPWFQSFLAFDPLRVIRTHVGGKLPVSAHEKSI